MADLTLTNKIARSDIGRSENDGPDMGAWHCRIWCQWTSQWWTSHRQTLLKLLSDIGFFTELSRVIFIKLYMLRIATFELILVTLTQVGIWYWAAYHTSHMQCVKPTTRTPSHRWVDIHLCL